MIFAAARVVTSTRVHEPGWVEVSGAQIVGVGGPDCLSAGPVRDLGDVTLVPGFVDIHVHGGGGGSFTDGSRASAWSARAAHLNLGTTTCMASLVTATPEETLAHVRLLATLAPEHIRGIHLEGPWLSPARAGAHDSSKLRSPDPAEIDLLIEAGGGNIAMVTLAPELPGALDAIQQFVSAGVRVAIGHTDADYETTRRAIDAGATIATHLCNAMRLLHQREPGPVLALLEDPRVYLEVIADGTHLHPAVVSSIEAAAGLERTLYITDAMAAADSADGAYRLGVLDVDVTGGVARVAGSDTIAGSTATMDALFRGRVLGLGPGHGHGLELGSEGSAAEPFDANALIAAVNFTATTPARAMGWYDVGDIAAGLVANFVLFDTDLRVRDVIHRGRF